MNILQDKFGRQIDYVRLSVTDRCDLRCFYCLPKQFRDFQEPAEWLSFDEIQRVISAFARLGVSRIRITGGEPLVRRNLPQLIHQLSTLDGIDDLSLSTNATRLQRSATALYDAGIRRINVSLDTLREDRYKKITGGKLQKTLAGLITAKELGFSPIKINMVAMKGVNDDEFEDMVDFCLEHDFTLRFIETMPVGATGKNATNHYYDLQELKERLTGKFDLIPGVMPGGGPARYLHAPGTNVTIGFITPMSQHFCETCNRVRLSVDGKLYLCLGQNDQLSLREPLRDGISDAELEKLIIKGINMKPEKHDFNEKPGHVVRFMSHTGG